MLHIVGRTSLLVQLTTDKKWHYIYGTPAGLMLIKPLISNLVSIISFITLFIYINKILVNIVNIIQYMPLFNNCFVTY